MCCRLSKYQLADKMSKCLIVKFPQLFSFCQNCMKKIEQKRISFSGVKGVFPVAGEDI